MIVVKAMRIEPEGGFQYHLQPGEFFWKKLSLPSGRMVDQIFFAGPHPADMGPHGVVVAGHDDVEGRKSWANAGSYDVPDLSPSLGLHCCRDGNTHQCCHGHLRRVEYAGGFQAEFQWDKIADKAV